MKLYQHFLFLILVFICHAGFGQDRALIRMNIRVLDATDGSIIDGQNIRLSYFQTNNSIPLKKEKRESFYEVLTGSRIKVDIVASGYYPHTEIVDTDNIYDGDIIDIALNPRHGGSILVVVQDSKTKEPVEATIKFIKGTEIDTKITSKDNSIGTEFFYETEGEYSLLVSAPEYVEKNHKSQLKFGKGEKSNVVLIHLEKNVFSQNIIFKNSVDFSEIKPPLRVEILNITNKDKTTIWSNTKSSFDYSVGDTYNINIEKDGYKPLFTQLKPDGKSIELTLNPIRESRILVQLLSAGRSQKVDATINVTTPSGENESMKSNTVYIPKTAGQYVFTYSKPGFLAQVKTYDVTFNEDQITLPLVDEPEVEYQISVFDSETRQVIKNAEISISDDSSHLYDLMTDNGIFTLKRPPLLLPIYEISAEGYKISRDKVSPSTGNVKISVYLKKEVIEKFQEYEVLFKDKITGQSISNVQMIILDENKKPVETLYNAAKGIYMTYKINPDKVYSVAAEAEGYHKLRTNFQGKNREVEYYLEPLKGDEVIISIYDEYTREMLMMDQIEIDAAESAKINVSERNREYISELQPNVNYILKTKKKEYPDIEKIFKINDLNNHKMDLFIRKEEYPLSLKIQNDLSEEQKSKAKAIISYQSGENLSNTFVKEEKSFDLLSDPRQNLQIEIDIPGFRLYKASNNRQKLAMFEINVTLVPLEEPKAPEIVAVEPELPKIEQPAPVIESGIVKETVPEKPIEVKPEVAKPAEPMQAKKGNRYKLDGVNFEQSKTIMLYGSELKLQEVLKFMNDNPNVIIEVIGHTDKIGDERQNQRLSEFRARTVANWLFNHGINPGRILTSGKGSSEPIAPNDTEETKAQNRRIEILVIED